MSDKKQITVDVSLVEGLQFYTEAYSRLLTKIREEGLEDVFHGGDENAFSFLENESERFAKEAFKVFNPDWKDD